MFFFRKVKNKKVDFLIVGAQKCGTTALHEFLSLHPKLQSPPFKELYFFSNNYNYDSLGIDWYHARWKKFGNRNKLYYESSPDYFYYPFCSERIAKYNPDMKFILMVRDPVKRAYSHYNMLWQLNADPIQKEKLIKRYFINMNPETEYSFNRTFGNPDGFPGFMELVNEELDFIEHPNDRKNKFALGILSMGFYLEQLKQYYKYFPKERFIIFEDKDLENTPEEVMKKICLFLNIKPIRWNNAEIHQNHNKGKYANPMNESMAKTLSLLFKSHNEAFFSHIGKRYEWT
ncbi:MAG: sulfotransferase domain-containing protein [Bacteroidia bacterium]